MAPIPLSEALPIARQIADALDAVNHKECCPSRFEAANIKVTADGRVKVLDFGLAKAMEREHGSETGSHAHALSVTPTITTPAMTGVGMILGRQRTWPRNRRVARTWTSVPTCGHSGACCTELLTGVRTFTADEFSDTLAFVLTKDPDGRVCPRQLPSRSERFCAVVSRKIERNVLRTSRTPASTSRTR